MLWASDLELVSNLHRAAPRKGVGWAVLVRWACRNKVLICWSSPYSSVVGPDGDLEELAAALSAAWAIAPAPERGEAILYG